MSLKPVLRHPTLGALKNVNFLLSRNSTKFDMLTRFHETILTVKSSFCIRDLEKFRISTKITILPFFRKLEFSQVLHPMQTRSKSGFFKPRVYATSHLNSSKHPSNSLQTTSESTCVENALASPMWKKAMDEEFSALI